MPVAFEIENTGWRNWGKQKTKQTTFQVRNVPVKSWSALARIHNNLTFLLMNTKIMAYFPKIFRINIRRNVANSFSFLIFVLFLGLFCTTTTTTNNNSHTYCFLFPDWRSTRKSWLCFTCYIFSLLQLNQLLLDVSWRYVCVAIKRKKREKKKREPE